jgi:glycosyltransferase involved in cell wall biosynthesis
MRDRLDSVLEHGRDDLAVRLTSRRADHGDGQGDRRLKTRPTVSVVIPAMNEELNLPFVLPKIGDWVNEIILVDGCSTDSTRDIARQLVPGIHVIEQRGQGKGAALRSGFAAATGDLIVMLDADGSTDPREIPIFVGALAAGAEFVKGTRFRQGGGSADMTVVRRIGNRALVRLVRILFGGSFSDLCYGYNAFWKRVLPCLELDSDGFEIETEMSLRALHAGLRVVEVPSFEHERIHGDGHLRTFPDGWRVLKLILREKRQRLPAPELRPASEPRMPTPTVEST